MREEWKSATQRHLHPTNDSWRVDETYIEVKGKWKYLYRAVDSQGNTIDFLLTAYRDATAAKRFLGQIHQPNFWSRCIINSLSKEFSIFKSFRNTTC
jgi:transposase-like protein